MPHSWRWLALGLPLLVLALAVTRAELFVNSAQELSLPIQGYDPRDLLQGHYLQFRLALDLPPSAAACAQADCCVCLTRAPGQVAALAAPASCTEAHSRCDAALPLGVAQGSWRFYVPETQAQDMERVLREAHAQGQAFAVLAISRNGEARVRELLLNGRHYGSGLKDSARR